MDNNLLEVKILLTIISIIVIFLIFSVDIEIHESTPNDIQINMEK